MLRKFTGDAAKHRAPSAGATHKSAPCRLGARPAPTVVVSTTHDPSEAAHENETDRQFRLSQSDEP